MIRKDTQRLILNGKTFGISEMALLSSEWSQEGQPEWMRSFSSFVMQWYTGTETLEVTTSGTTGEPKSWRFSREAMRKSARITGEFFGFEKGKSVVLCLSCRYIAGIMMVVRAAEYQMNLIALPPVLSPLKALDTAQTADFVAMVPAQVYESLQEEETRQKLKTIATLLIGGAPLDEKLENEIQKIHTNAWCSYGMTETLTHAGLRKIGDDSPRHVYAPLPGFRFAINTDGCLVIDTPYFPEPVVTRDRGTLLEGGQFRWTGRADFVINSGGVKIFPDLLETKLSAFFPLPCFVTSFPDEAKGEIPVLVVQSVEKPGEEVLLEWMELLRRHLPAASCPIRILTVPAFIYTGSGKIDRNQTLLRFSLR